MRFAKHSELSDRHAFLSPSKYHWINYTDEKVDSTFRTALASAKGTRLHELAQQLINENVKLPRTKQTLNTYVNDAIGYRMSTEVTLYYSDNAFGTADTISFRNNLLRIHDLKTGVSKASMWQLQVYAAMFCLEYKKEPNKIAIELRIYQSDAIELDRPDPEITLEVMDTILRAHKVIDELKAEV